MAVKLVSMKMSKAERKKQVEPSLAAGEGPVYPYGLTINLDDAALEKLGITDLPTIDESYMLIAKVDVTNVSSNASRGGSNRSMSLQITDCCLEDADDAGGKKKKGAAALYDGDEGKK